MLRDSVSLGEVARYLEAGVRITSEHLRRVAEDDRLYVVTAVLKSASFATASIGASEGRLRAGAPELGGAVDLRVEGELAGVSGTVVSFTGRRPLAFAFQAIHLLFEDGAYADYASREGMVAFEMRLPGAPVPGCLVLDEDLVELDG